MKKREPQGRYTLWSSGLEDIGKPSSKNNTIEGRWQGNIQNSCTSSLHILVASSSTRSGTLSGLAVSARGCVEGNRLKLMTCLYCNMNIRCIYNIDSIQPAQAQEVHALQSLLYLRTHTYTHDTWRPASVESKDSFLKCVSLCCPWLTWCPSGLLSGSFDYPLLRGKERQVHRLFWKKHDSKGLVCFWLSAAWSVFLWALVLLAVKLTGNGW